MNVSPLINLEPIKISSRIIINKDKSLTINSKPEKLEDISIILKEITSDEKKDLIDTNLFNVEYLLESLFDNVEANN